MTARFDLLDVLPHPTVVWADGAVWFANRAARDAYTTLDWAFQVGPTAPTGTVARTPDGDLIELHVTAATIDGRDALVATLRRLDDAYERATSSELITGILHNVGNVLNSVAVSGARLSEALQRSRVGLVGKAAHMLVSQPDPVAFLTTDDRGRQLPGYLARLGTWLDSERTELKREVRYLLHSIEHLKAVVATQQRRARLGTEEGCVLHDVVQIAVDILDSSLEQHGVRVTRELDPLPTLEIDANAVLQILLNLLDNAVDAMRGQDGERSIHVEVVRRDDRFEIAVTDSGPGVPADVAERLFSRGFTTKEDGHGFGLHASAHAARQLGGSLTLAPREAGKGARFVIELPLKPHYAPNNGAASWLMGPLRGQLDTAG